MRGELPIQMSSTRHDWHLVRAGGLLMAISLLVAATVANAVALESTPAEDDPAKLVDLDIIAAMNNWTIEEARAHEDASDALIGAVTRLAIERPDVFVGSAVGSSPYDPPTIYIKGLADDHVRDLIASAPVYIKLVDGQPYSRDELDDRRNAVHSSLLQAGYTQVATRANILRKGALEVTIGWSQDQAPSLETLLDLLPATIRGDVSIKIVDYPIVVAENAAFGGMTATYQGELYCTSGWAVQHETTGTTGWTTAGHCVGAVDGIRHPGYGVHGASYQDDVTGPIGDLSWYTSPQAEPASSMPITTTREM